jgi:hypothetical protein
MRTVRESRVGELRGRIERENREGGWLLLRSEWRILRSGRRPMTAGS